MSPFDFQNFVTTAMITTIDIWLIYCIWFRRKPVSLLEVTMVHVEERKKN